MGRKSKYSAMEKLKIINEAKLIGDSAAAKAYYINNKKTSGVGDYSINIKD